MLDLSCMKLHCCKYMYIYHGPASSTLPVCGFYQSIQLPIPSIRGFSWCNNGVTWSRAHWWLQGQASAMACKRENWPLLRKRWAARSRSSSGLSICSEHPWIPRNCASSCEYINSSRCRYLFYFFQRQEIVQHRPLLLSVLSISWCFAIYNIDTGRIGGYMLINWPERLRLCSRDPATCKVILMLVSIDCSFWADQIDFCNWSAIVLPKLNLLP